MKKYVCIFLFSAFFYSLGMAYAIEAVITSVSGTVEVYSQTTKERVEAKVGEMLSLDHVIYTRKNSTAEITLSTGHQIKVNENTIFSLQSLTETKTKVKLPFGKLRAKVSKLTSGEEFEVETPAATCSIRGTEFELAVNQAGETRLAVFTGMVEAREMITGKSVIVGAGAYSSIIKGVAPTEPKPMEEKGGEDKGEKETKSTDDRLADAKREIFEEISKQQVLDQAAEEIKQAEYQNGKALIDAYGKRVRLEEYIMRTDLDQFKYVVLNERDNRFDFGKILFTFNKNLPEDLNLATKGMFHSEKEAPVWYPTDILSVMSNTIDTVTEEASGGHPQSSGSGGSVYYDTVFDQYDFSANNTSLWGYDKTSVPESEYYYGDTAPTSVWSQPGGSQLFHFTAKDTYADGTWIQAEDFIINDEGDIASFSDIVDPSKISADDIRSKILQMNFERVYTSSLFDGRTIDLVFSSKLLSDAGILNLPASLGAPSIMHASEKTSYNGQSPSRMYDVVRLRETSSGDVFPEPEKPYEKQSAPEVDEVRKMISHVATAEFLGGQYFVEGDNTSLKGNINMMYVPVINFSENTALLPIYQGAYNGTKGVEELVGGGTLVQKTMEHSLYAKLVHKTSSNWTYKNILGYSGKWLAETEDEALSDGLFNNYRYSLGLAAEKAYKSWKFKLGYDYGMTDYINYESLSSDSKFADAGITSSMGTDVLDFNSHDFSIGAVIPMRKSLLIDTEYRMSYLVFTDQKIVIRSGEYKASKRHDIGNTLQVNTIVDMKTARLGLGYGLQYYISNQNAYDANRTFFTDNYYDYIEQKITPSISFLLGDKSSTLSLYWDIAFTKYTDRKVQDISGEYGTSKIGQVTNGFGLWLNYPLYKQLNIKMKLNYLMSSSNMKHESTYTYNYDVVNYFVGFGWQL
ncbi:MAG: FecR family protein [bacterium]